MARPASIVAAELQVAQSRRDLRQSLQQLRHRLSQPSSLAAALALGVLLGFSLSRRGRASAVVGMLATAVLRHGVEYLIASKTPPATGLPSK